MHDATRMRLDGFEGRVALVTGAARGIGQPHRRDAARAGRQGRRRATSRRPRTRASPGSRWTSPTRRRSRPPSPRSSPPSARSTCSSSTPASSSSSRSRRRRSRAGGARWRVNLDGAFLCARRALPGMEERGYGRDRHASARRPASRAARKNVAAYAASKAGLMAFTKAIAQEYMRTGITANTLAPTLIRTPMIGEMARPRGQGADRPPRRARRRRGGGRVPAVRPRLVHHGRDRRRQRRLADRLRLHAGDGAAGVRRAAGAGREAGAGARPRRGAGAGAGLRRVRLRPVPAEGRLRADRCRSSPATRRAAWSTRSARASRAGGRASRRRCTTSRRRRATAGRRRACRTAAPTSCAWASTSTAPSRSTCCARPTP